MTLKFAAAVCIALAVPATVHADTASDAAELIPYLVDELDDVRGAIEGRASGGAGGWFTDGAADYQADLDRLLDRALDLISPKAHARWTEEVRRIDEALEVAEALQAELTLERRSAQRSDGARMVDRLMGREHPPGTIEDLEVRLAEAEGAVRTLNAERQAASSALAADLRAEHGIELTPDQARAALLSVHGGLMVESAVVVRVLAAAEAQLGELKEKGLTGDTARRYLGAASITRLVHARMLARHLAAYDGEWLPRLRTMRAETSSLLSETQERQRSAGSDSAREAYRRNTETQARILGVIDQYEALLLNRRTMTEAALRQATERADVVINTLETLEAAMDMSGLLDQAWSEYQAVSEIDVPELLNLEGEDFDQFLDISRQLGAGM